MRIRCFQASAAALSKVVAGRVGNARCRSLQNTSASALMAVRLFSTACSADSAAPRRKVSGGGLRPEWTNSRTVQPWCVVAVLVFVLERAFCGECLGFCGIIFVDQIGMFTATVTPHASRRPACRVLHRPSECNSGRGDIGVALKASDFGVLRHWQLSVPASVARDCWRDRSGEKWAIGATGSGASHLGHGNTDGSDKASSSPSFAD